MNCAKQNTDNSQSQWADLFDHATTLSSQCISQLFESDTRRFESFSIQHEDLLFDYSKNLITPETRQMLINTLENSDFYNARNDLFSGNKINITEDRAALHTALRQQGEHPLHVDGYNIIPDIKSALNKMYNFSKRLRNKKYLGYSGKPISNIVNIGIGGSHIGPMMVVNALKGLHHPDLTCDFVSNVDGHDIQRITQSYDPETTLFLIASKTFTTQETMLNAQTARTWVVDHYKTDQAVQSHFVALSTNEQGVEDFGIDPENMFTLWDWVGGRYSLWSSIGLPIAIMVGMDNFETLLAGAHSIDKHFKSSALEENIPVLMALVGFWNRNILGYQCHAMIPYDCRLSLLPAWLQQADMESNGKTVTRHGQTVQHATGPLIMGGSGTDVQHSFFQWMHQGTDPTPIDFILCAQPEHTHTEHHKILVTHFLAQQRALMQGIENTDEPHRNFPGSRPSNALIIERLTPYSLGQLLAIYEHKIFVQGILWNINSFDQYGVELGKTMANDIQNNWDQDKSGYDSSTQGQFNYIEKCLQPYE